MIFFNAWSSWSLSAGLWPRLSPFLWRQCSSPQENSYSIPCSDFDWFSTCNMKAHGLQSKVNSKTEYFASMIGGGDLNMHTQNRTDLKGFLVCKTPEGKTKRSICSRHWSSWKEQTIRMSSATFPDTISSSNCLKGLYLFRQGTLLLALSSSGHCLSENRLSLLWCLSSSLVNCVATA